MEQQLFAGWKGLDYRVPSTLENLAYWSNSGNMRIRDGVAERRNGHSLLSALLTAPAVSLNCYQKFDGSWYLIGFSKIKAEKLNTTSGLFESISGAISFTGDDDDFFSACMYTDDFIFCNGIDDIHKWNGTGNIADAGTGYAFKVLLPFGERLCGYNQQSGTAVEQRIRYSVPGSPYDFAGAGSGFYDLVSQLQGDPIVAAEILGNGVAIYGNEHIVMQRWIGGRTVFSFDPIVIPRGIIGVHALVAFPNMHLIAARDNIYGFDGSPTLQPIGDPIKKWMYSNINRLQWHRTFMEYRENTHEAVCFFPSSNALAGTCDMYVCYNVDTGNWTKGTTLGYTCGTRYRTTTSKTVGELIGTIGSQISWRIGDALAGTNFPYSAYGMKTGAVLKDDELVVKDNGVNFTGFFDTVDINITERPDRYMHLFDMLLEAIGGDVTISYSTDEGVSFTLVTTFTSGAEWTVFWKDLSQSEKKLRFRFSGTDAFGIRRFILNYLKGTNIL